MKDIRPGVMCMIRGASHTAPGGVCDCGNGKIVEIVGLCPHHGHESQLWLHSGLKCEENNMMLTCAEESVLFPIIDPDAVREHDRAVKINEDLQKRIDRMIDQFWSLT